MKRRAGMRQRRDIIREFGFLFTPGAPRHCLDQVPAGWLPLVGLALGECGATTGRVRVKRLTVHRGILRAVFRPGGDAAAEAQIQQMLAECRAYCPCCGHLRASDT